MTSKKNRARSAKDTTKKVKKKTSVLVQEKVEFVDYKDINLLQRFLSDRSKIRGRRVNGNSEQQQREVAQAIKNAREMALLPYTKRVASAGRAPRPPRDSEPKVDESAIADVESTETDELVEAGAVTEEG